MYGINSPNTNIQEVNQKQYYLPYGCRVAFIANSPGKKEIKKFFTIFDNATINLEFDQEKKLIFNENFKNNRKSWDLDSKIEQTWSGTKVVYKFSIEDNALLVENNAYNQFYYMDKHVGLTTNDDYEINMEFKVLKGSLYLKFDASNSGRAFSYIQYNKYKYKLGHNNWDDRQNNWINWGGGEPTYTGEKNSIKIVRKNKNYSVFIHDNNERTFVRKKLYGSKIGIGLADNSKAEVYSLKIYRFNKETKNILEKDKIYFCSASKLNVRKDGKGTEEIARIIQGEPVYYLGEYKEKKSKAYFLDEEINDHFYKVKLLSGSIGWVHGGGLSGLTLDKNPTLENFKLDLLNPQIIITKEEETATIPLKKEDRLLDTIKTPPSTDSPSIYQKDSLPQQVKETKIEKDIIKENVKKPKIEKPKPKKMTCPTCFGNKNILSTCAFCTNGHISSKCTSCNGNYKSAKDLCPQCSGLGCDYCDYDGQACDVCTKGFKKTIDSHCSGTGKTKKICHICKGKGKIYK